MKFSKGVVPLKMTSASYFLISQLQPFKNGGLSNFCDG